MTKSYSTAYSAEDMPWNKETVDNCMVGAHLYIQEAYLPKPSISGQIVSEILAQLCADDSMQILRHLT